jgi:hypothetical protein
LKKAPRFFRTRTALTLECLVLFLLAAFLVRPLFKTKYADKWASIESTFIADARFLVDHWPHPRWQPLWYTGTRYDYIYPPALRYGSAVISRTLGVIPAKGYHIYTALFYCVAIAGVYFFLRIVTGSRGAAWLGAMASLLLSPALLFLPVIRADSWLRVPVRLGVMTRYGEGPHISAFAIIPIALAFTWLALERRRPFALAAAAFFCALVVSHNFYGATALALFFPILVWSFWITHQDKAILVRAAVIPALAYGLTAFWLVPSYFQITIGNLKYVSPPGTTWSLWIFIAVAIAYLVLTDRFWRGRKDRVYAILVIGSVVFFSLNVLGNAYFDFRVTGEPSRLVPELDFVLILAAVEGIRWLWRFSPSPRLPVSPSLAKGIAVVLTAASFASAIPYLRRHRNFFPRDLEYQRRIEYRITDWVSKNLPDARVLAAGSIRFWYDAWHDLQHVGGGSEQGMINGLVAPAQWEVLLGNDASLAVQWLICMGADAMIVNYPNSQDVYHDYQFPKRFEGVLPVIYDNHEGDVIYKIPRRVPGLAHVVNAAQHRPLRTPANTADMQALRAYSELLDAGGPATLVWQGSDSMRVHAVVAPGQTVVVQESYDPAWHATSAGKPLAVRKDAMNFLTIDAPPGEHDIAIVFELPLENVIGRIVTVASLVVLVSLAVAGLRGGELRGPVS